MRRYLYSVIILSLLALTGSLGAAELKTEAGLLAGYAGNLFSDADRIADSYSSLHIGADIYPNRSSLIGLFGNYTAYHTYTDLGSTSGGAQVAFLPISGGSPLTVSLSANISGQAYGSFYQAYDYNNGGGAVAVGYALHSNIIVRSGLTADLTRFPNSVTADHRSFGLFMGFNITLPGYNSVDIEAGYGEKDFYEMETALRGYGSSLHSADAVSGLLPAYHINLRYSRPLGSATGLSLAYETRRFGEATSAFINDFADYSFSPWASDWEGDMVSLAVKSYLLPGLIISAGGNYQDRSYVTTLTYSDESPADDPVEYRRDDRRFSIYCVFNRPFKAGAGTLIKPTLRFDYTGNESTDPFYDFSHVTATVGINLDY